MNFLQFAVDFSLKSINEWRKLFYIVIEALYLHDIFIYILSIYIRGTPGTRLINQFFFCLNPIIVRKWPEKEKELYFIKLVSKWKSAIRKRHAKFSQIRFWDLKLMPIDLASDSASRCLTRLFKNVGVVPRKAVRFENLG